MPPLWTADELARLTEGRWLSAQADVTGLAYLPRRVKPGDLYVALTYEGFDHHNSVAAAFEKGAAAALVTQTPPGVPATAPLLITSDLTEALWRLAKVARDRAQGKFIGITGRIGKTFTKDTLAHLLSKQAPTQKSEGNDNDTTGTGITLARQHPNTAYGVWELSLAQYGDVANSVLQKSLLARPHVAIVTRIGGTWATLESLRQQHREVADAKALLFRGLEPGGVAIINRDDDEVFDSLLAHARNFGVSRIVTFGQHPASDIRMTSAKRTPTGFDVEILVHGSPRSFSIGVRGRHFLDNTLAVLGAVEAVGANMDQSLAALPEIHESPGRGNIYAFPVSGGNAYLLDFTRKVTLGSLNASFELLAELAPGPGGRRIVVLSDFAELAVQMASFAPGLAATIANSHFDLVFAVGQPILPLYEQLPSATRAGYSPNVDAIIPLVKKMLRPGDILLIQGQRSSHLYRLPYFLIGPQRYLPWF